MYELRTLEIKQWLPRLDANRNTVGQVPDLPVSNLGNIHHRCCARVTAIQPELQ